MVSNQKRGRERNEREDGRWKVEDARWKKKNG